MSLFRLVAISAVFTCISGHIHVAVENVTPSDDNRALVHVEKYTVNSAGSYVHQHPSTVPALKFYNEVRTPGQDTKYVEFARFENGGIQYIHSNCARC